MADWQKIKTEYITTDTSYRKLGQKYGIHYKVISEKGKDEGWVTLRSQHRDKTLTKALDRICEDKVDRAARLNNVADKLMGLVESFIDGCEQRGINITDTQSMKHISGVLKDIKEIQMIRSDADMREQEARIANLRKQAEADEGNKEPVKVIIEDGLKDYSK